MQCFYVDSETVSLYAYSIFADVGLYIIFADVCKPVLCSQL